MVRRVGHRGRGDQADPQVLLFEDLSDRRDLLSRGSDIDAAIIHPLPAARVDRHRWLGQAAAENLGRHILEFAPLLHGTHFHDTQEIIGNIEGRFHIDE